MKKKAGPSQTATFNPAQPAMKLARAYPPILLMWLAASTSERTFVPSRTGKLTLTTLSTAGLKKMKTKSPRNDRSQVKGIRRTQEDAGDQAGADEGPQEIRHDEGGSNVHPVDDRSGYRVDEDLADVAKDEDQGGDHGVLALLCHNQNSKYAQEPVADTRKDPARQEEVEISSDICRNHRATLMTMNCREQAPDLLIVPVFLRSTSRLRETPREPTVPSLCKRTRRQPTVRQFQTSPGRTGRRRSAGTCSGFRLFWPERRRRRHSASLPRWNGPAPRPPHPPGIFRKYYRTNSLLHSTMLVAKPSPPPTGNTGAVPGLHHPAYSSAIPSPWVDFRKTLSSSATIREITWTAPGEKGPFAARPEAPSGEPLPGQVGNKGTVEFFFFKGRKTTRVERMKRQIGPIPTAPVSPGLSRPLEFPPGFSGRRSEPAAQPGTRPNGSTAQAMIRARRYSPRRFSMCSPPGPENGCSELTMKISLRVGGIQGDLQAGSGHWTRKAFSFSERV